MTGLEPVACDECDDVFGFAEDGDSTQAECPTCYFRDHLIAAAAEAYRRDAGIDGRALADDWGVEEHVVARVVDAHSDVVEWGVSPMAPFPAPDFDPDDYDVDWGKA